MSAATAAEATDPDWQFERLGEYRLRGFESGAVLFQVAATGLRSDFPPLRVPGVVNHNLPALPAPLVGRDDDLRRVRGLLLDGRLVTLVGPGVAAVSAILDRLLDRCLDLTVGTTSREPLGQRRATVYDLRPLPEDDAVDLLIARADRAGWGAATDGEDLAALAKIADRLDGLPLALELVGAQLGDRTPRQVLDELRDTEVRTESAVLAPAMRSSLAWSYELLDEESAGCFRRLSVFTGEFTLEGAVDRHVARYLAVAEGAAGVLEFGPARRPEAEPLSADVEDLRAALSRAASRSDEGAALTIGRVGAAVCTVLSRLTEARICLEETIAAAPGRHPDRARAAADLAAFLLLTGEYDDAKDWASEASRLAVTSGSAHAEALALRTLALLAANANDLDLAAASGDHRRAVELLSFAEGHRRGTHVSPPHAYQESNERVLVAARAEVGPTAFADAWRAGKQIDLETAIGLATSRRDIRHTEPGRPAGKLSERESQEP